MSVADKQALITELETLVAPKNSTVAGTKTSSPAKFMVGPASLAISQDTNLSLCTYPLGACLGIAIYDAKAKVGGLLHSLLPSSNLDPQRALACPGMFIDTGLAALLAAAHKLNATKENIRICVAGAAQIMDEMMFFNVGKSNYDMLNEMLPQLDMKVHAEHTGGRNSCSMELVLADGEVRLKFCGQPTARILCKL